MKPALLSRSRYGYFEVCMILHDRVTDGVTDEVRCSTGHLIVRGLYLFESFMIFWPVRN